MEVGFSPGPIRLQSPFSFHTSTLPKELGTPTFPYMEQSCLVPKILQGCTEVSGGLPLAPCQGVYRGFDTCQ